MYSKSFYCYFVKSLAGDRKENKQAMKRHELMGQAISFSNRNSPWHTPIKNTEKKEKEKEKKKGKK